jgi:hypothetical protein
MISMFKFKSYIVTISVFHNPPFDNPVEAFPAATFYQLTGFWPGKF